jgi:hypothetical protein
VKGRRTLGCCFQRSFLGSSVFRWSSTSGYRDPSRRPRSDSGSPETLSAAVGGNGPARICPGAISLGREQGGSAACIHPWLIQRSTAGGTEASLALFPIPGRTVFHPRTEPERFLADSDTAPPCRLPWGRITDTPTPPPREVNVVLAQNSPDLIVTELPQGLASSAPDHSP